MNAISRYRVVKARQDAIIRRGGWSVMLPAKLHLRLHVRERQLPGEQEKTQCWSLEFPSGARTGQYLEGNTAFEVARVRCQRFGLEA